MTVVQDPGDEQMTRLPLPLPDGKEVVGGPMTNTLTRGSYEAMTMSPAAMKMMPARTSFFNEVESGLARPLRLTCY